MDDLGGPSSQRAPAPEKEIPTRPANPAPGERRFRVLVNPEAGRGHAEERLDLLLGDLPDSQRRRVAIWEVRSVSDCRERVADLDPHEVPVAAGGDGTVTMVAMALEAAGRLEQAIGILPLGTGNILARELALHGPRVAVQALVSGVARPVDVMRTSHRDHPLALISVSVGFEARFIERYASLRRYGRPIGILAGIASIPRRASGIRLEADGEDLVGRTGPPFSAGLYSAARYALGRPMNPGAEVSDGWGDAAVYRSFSDYLETVRTAVAPGGSSYPTGPGVVRRRWTEGMVASDGPMQIDGESVEPGETSVWLDPGGLSVLAPAPP